ncbi:putative reverse transcriptase domain-containing protein [Tanacetum coccineum]
MRISIIKETLQDSIYRIESPDINLYTSDQEYSERKSGRAALVVLPSSSTYLNLGLGELAHTRLIVELADRTVKYPKWNKLQNEQVGIGDKFTFPVDFIILDMPEDIKVPLILGRPFLSTARAKIDVYKRKITLRVGEENNYQKVTPV